MEKFLSKYQREIDRAIKWTLKKAGVKKNATPEQIKSCIFNYVSTGKPDYWKMCFSEDMLKDKDFLLSIYRANPTVTLYNKFLPSPEVVIDDVDFMMEYVKISHKHRMKDHPLNELYEHWDESEIEIILHNYTRVMSNPVFVTRLAQEFPNIRLVPFVKRNICKVHYWDDKAKKEEREAQDYETYKAVLAKLPIEILCDQARKYGSATLNEIPNEIPNFNQIVSAGIEKDGFNSLRALDLTQILDNKDLIIKAYEKDGIRALHHYISRTLNPYRSCYYMEHDDQKHQTTTFDSRCAEVQDALRNDTQIHYIFKKEDQLNKLKEDQFVQARPSLPAKITDKNVSIK